MHWKKLFNNRFLGSWDLEGRESATVVIDRVETERVQNTQGQSEEVPVVYFAGSKTGKGMILNRTNARAIAIQHGNDTSKWPGKKIVLAVETVNAFGQQTDALRVHAPTSRKQKQAAAILAEPGETETETHDTEDIPQ